MIDWEDFQKLDIRAGTILEVEDFPAARKPAYKLKIDFGEAGILDSSAQITQLYKKEELLGTQVVAVINLGPKKIAGFISECLVLGIYNKKKEVVLLKPTVAVENGDRVG